MNNQSHPYLKKGAFSLFLVAIFAAALIAGCGGKHDKSPTSSAPADELSLGPTARLLEGEAPAPELTGAENIARTAALTPSCPPPQGASGFNSRNSYYSPAKAFDGDFKSWWAGISAAGSWDLYYGFSSARNITKIFVNFYGTAYTPSQIKLKISSDGCSWTDLGAMPAGTKPYLAVNSSVKYFWLEMTGNPSAGFPLIRDVNWEPISGKTGAWATPGANDDWYFPQNAFDNNPATWWAGLPAAASWDLYYNFPSPQQIGVLTAKFFSLNHVPATATVYTSSDGISWTAAGRLGVNSNTLPITLTGYVGSSGVSFLKISMQGNPPSGYPVITDVTYDYPSGASSGDSASTSFNAANAFDNNPATYWKGAAGQSEWNLYYNFTAATSPTSVQVIYQPSGYFASSTTLHTSNDGISWATQTTLSAGITAFATTSFSSKHIRIRMTGSLASPAPIVRDVLFNTPPSQWVEVGAGSASGNGISGSSGGYDPVMAFDASGNPIIAWIGGGSAQVVYVKRWNGSQWVEMGSGSASGNGIISPSSCPGDCTSNDLSITSDSTGKPIIAWTYYVFNYTNNTHTKSIYLKRWNGTAWIEAGGSATGSGVGAGVLPAVKSDSYGNPVVIWRNPSGSLQYNAGPLIFAKKWNGSAWVEIGSGSSTNGINPTSDGCNMISNQYYSSNHMRPGLIIDASGNPVATWNCYSNIGNFMTVMKRWNGSAWAEMGSGTPTTYKQITKTTTDTWQHLLKGSDGNPIVVWDATDRFFVQKWNGSSWQEIGTSSCCAVDPKGMPITFFLNESSLYGSSTAFGQNRYPMVAIGPSGMPFVAWGFGPMSTQTLATTYAPGEIFVKKFNGTSWVETNPGSASGGGISNSTNLSSASFIASNASGQVYITWTVQKYGSGTIDKVYVKKYQP